MTFKVHVAYSFWIVTHRHSNAVMQLLGCSTINKSTFRQIIECVSDYWMHLRHNRWKSELLEFNYEVQFEHFPAWIPAHNQQLTAQMRISARRTEVEWNFLESKESIGRQNLSIGPTLQWQVTEGSVRRPITLNGGQQLSGDVIIILPIRQTTRLAVRHYIINRNFATIP